MPITVYAAKVNGDDYDSVPMNVKGSGAGGNGGAAAKITSTSKLDGVATSRTNFDVFGSTIVDTNDVNPIFDPAVYTDFKFPHNHVKPIGMRIKPGTAPNGEAIAIADYILESAANVPWQIQSIHYQTACAMGCGQGVKTRRFTTAIRENHYNRFTGKWDAGYPVVETDFWLGIDGGSGDTAATVTRSVPGRLVFKTGKYVPVSQDYEAKNG
jgi:hypothetical protein